MKRQWFASSHIQLATLLGLVLLFGFALVYDVVRSSIENQMALSSSMILSSLSTPAGANEGLLETDSLGEWIEPNSVVSMPWDCKTAEIELEGIHISQIQLTGTCLGQIQTLDNRTNGYTAQVFRMDKTAFTDYIWLDKGENQLSLKWEDENKGSGHPPVLTITIHEQSL